jgi:hypothetical protein
MLSINVAEWCVILVGLVMVGIIPLLMAILKKSSMYGRLSILSMSKF